MDENVNKFIVMCIEEDKLKIIKKKYNFLSFGGDKKVKKISNKKRTHHR